MIEELLPAIQERELWLPRFIRQAYPNAFREYGERFAPLYRAAIREAGGEAPRLAEALLDGVEAGWKGERLWRRTTRRFEEKQMVIVYLTPMLLESGESAFADCLREAWGRRWPKDAYQTATYEKLRRSFRNVVFGIELPRRDEDEA